MKVHLKELQPNPLRDFSIDPVDEDKIEQLVASIKRDDFWGGIVCRKHNGVLQVGAGWHRVIAAIKASHKEADVYVSNNMDDAQLVRVYATENATQRMNHGAATAGTVVAAIKVLAKVLLTGNTTSEQLFGGAKAFETAQGTFKKGKGIGIDWIGKFLQGIPNFSLREIREQLASLKQSGDYDRIVSEVYAELGIDQPEEEKAKARKKRPPIFDKKGVNKWIKRADHQETFRKMVTDEEVRKFLPVNQQAALAKALVEAADFTPKDGSDLPRGELTSRYIRERILQMLKEIKRKQKDLNAQEELELLKKDLRKRAELVQQDIDRHTRSIGGSMVKLTNLMKEWDKRKDELGDFPFFPYTIHVVDRLEQFFINLNAMLPVPKQKSSNVVKLITKKWNEEESA